MMKFALIRPWEFDAIYFETEELAQIAKNQIEEYTGRVCHAIIVKTCDDEKPKKVKSLK